MTFLGILLSLALSFSAEAQTLAVSTQFTDSSQVIVSGSAQAGTTWLWLQVTKVEDATYSENIFPTLTASAFSQKVYLKDGAGTYHIQVAQTSTVAQYTGAQYLVSEVLAVTNTDTVDHSYTYPSSVVQSDNAKIIALAQSITSSIATDMDRSKAIHDWVATNIAYDVAAATSGNLGLQDALGTLNTKIAVCSGYARLSAALHRAVNIPVRLTIGTATSDGVSGAHEWDEVSINQQWITEDPTWDSGAILAGTSQFFPMLSEKYFNPPAAVFALDHTRISVANE
jgi:transglutaminase/protease-like cytokinesis protein 3